MSTNISVIVLIRIVSVLRGKPQDADQSILMITPNKEIQWARKNVSKTKLSGWVKEFCFHCCTEKLNVVDHFSFPLFSWKTKTCVSLPGSQKWLHHLQHKSCSREQGCPTSHAESRQSAPPQGWQPPARYLAQWQLMHLQTINRTKQKWVEGVNEEKDRFCSQMYAKNNSYSPWLPSRLGDTQTYRAASRKVREGYQCWQTHCHRWAQPVWRWQCHFCTELKS